MWEARRARLGWAGTWTLVVAAGCSEDPVASPVSECPPVPLVAPAICAGEQAAFPDGRGGLACSPVGPDAAAAAARWRGLAAGPGVVWVTPGASGDGSRERPFGTLGEALSVGATTVALTAGTHPVADSLALPDGVGLVGEGASTVLQLEEGRALGVVNGARATLSALVVAGRDGALVGVVMAGAETRLEVEDVVFRRAETRVYEGGALLARRARWEGAVDGQLQVRGGGLAEVYNSALLGPDALGTFSLGVYVERACLILEGTAVVGHPGGGVQVQQAPRSTAACPAPVERRCAPAGGDQVRLCRAALVGNGLVGLYLNGEGASVAAREIHVDDTRSAAAASDPTARGGDGVYVAEGASLVLDGDATEGACGTRSVLRGNAGAGVYAGPGATVTVKRAAIQRSSPGVYVDRATGRVQVEHCRITLSGYAGIALDRPRDFFGACNGIYETVARAASVRGSVFPGFPALGDGISLVSDPAGRVDLHGNTLSANARFGLVVRGAYLGRIDENRGTENVFRGAVRVDLGGGLIANNPIGGRSDFVPEAGDAALLSGPPVGLCGEGAALCGRCVNAQSRRPCGRCDNVCVGAQQCIGGACVCPNAQTFCDGACVDTRASRLHCGACGRACGDGFNCRDGVCVLGRPSCPAGLADCAPTSADPACANLRMDARHCGACGNACPARQECVGGVCGCPGGQALCEGVCTTLSVDSRHCGACGNACAVGQECAAGRCVCARGFTVCGAPPVCVDTTTSGLHCGGCGRACPAVGQVCVPGGCVCPTGLTSCSAGAVEACVDLRTSAVHCGRCNNSCAAAQSCRGGVCVGGSAPSNDTRATATVIPLAAAAQDLRADTTSARHDTAGTCGCTGVGNDVFFTFTLTQPEIVYADTLGASWDTALFLQDSMGANLTSEAGGQVVCNNDTALCAGGRASQIVARLDVGRYYLVLSGCGAGAATIHFQHLPGGSSAGSEVIRPRGVVQTIRGSTSGGGRVSSGLCCTSGPERAYFWVTCPGALATALHATSCDAATGANLASYDVALHYWSALFGGIRSCNDDTPGVCGAGSSLTATVPPTAVGQAALNALYVDGCARPGSAAGDYAVNYILANCASGTRCGAACVDTSVDTSHCGGCDRRCVGRCRGGVCVP